MRAHPERKKHAQDINIKADKRFALPGETVLNRSLCCWRAMLTCASGSTDETDDGEVGNDAAQGRVVRRDACQRKTPPGQ